MARQASDKATANKRCVAKFLSATVSRNDLGLSTVIMPTNKLEQEFQRLYYKCLLKLRVNHCTIARE